jgi:hypothetical protein
MEKVQKNKTAEYKSYVFCPKHHLNCQNTWPGNNQVISSFITANAI